MRALPALAAVWMVLASGCSSTLPPTRLVLDPVGARPGGPRSGGEGHLRVYSATEDTQSGKLPYQIHTPYWVFDADGKQVRSVVNHVGETDQAPMLVRLPPGRYSIVARAEGYGQVTVPVVITAGRLTEVHLQRRGMEYLEGVPETGLVRLPAGPVVGFRAREPGAPQPSEARPSP